eukprot:TRINITY_DN9787_c0_g1_i1.p1 TRINITY_DN9787_c0_g1~~TRINITY_DN9787_c0_g1_i1.p1  ORF type:complete len:176 (-),score=26.71 TRINITY_DN9787_c0_g1_i1:13-540(-)
MIGRYVVSRGYLVIRRQRALYHRHSESDEDRVLKEIGEEDESDDDDDDGKRMWLLQPIVVYYILYVFFSLLGLTVSPFFYAFHLIDIAVHIETLQYVIKAATMRKGHVAASIVFGFILIYISTVIGFIFFRNEYGFGDDDQQWDCDTMSRCFQRHLDFGFRTAPVFRDTGQKFRI